MRTCRSTMYASPPPHRARARRCARRGSLRVGPVLAERAGVVGAGHAEAGTAPDRLCTTRHVPCAPLPPVRAGRATGRIEHRIRIAAGARGAAHTARSLARRDAARAREPARLGGRTLSGPRYTRTALRLDVDLSSRTLVLFRGRSVVRRMLVGVGRAGSETPTGQYAVTDKLPGPAYSAYYGCCILALSATQPNLPSGWTGGNRIAIHGTPSASDFGRAVSAGCLHARDSDLRYLMRSLPLGTPVVIRP